MLPDNAPEIVAAFETHSGSRYEAFLAALNGACRFKKRLLYWQEELWTTFLASHPEIGFPTFEDIQRLFALCHVHGAPLRLEAVPARYGLWRFPPDYVAAVRTQFPYANLMYAGDDIERDLGAKVTLPYCAECRAALESWNRLHGRNHGTPQS